MNFDECCELEFNSTRAAEAAGSRPTLNGVFSQLRAAGLPWLTILSVAAQVMTLISQGKTLQEIIAAILGKLVPPAPTA